MLARVKMTLKGLKGLAYCKTDLCCLLFKSAISAAQKFHVEYASHVQSSVPVVLP
jgi:hypothetical protein